MNELITIENNVAVLSVETADKIVEFIRKAKEIEEAEKALRERIQAEMESKKIKTIKIKLKLLHYRLI